MLALFINFLYFLYNFLLFSYFFIFLISILQTYFLLFSYTSHLVSAFYQNYPLTNQPVTQILIHTNFLNSADFRLFFYTFHYFSTISTINRHNGGCELFTLRRLRVPRTNTSQTSLFRRRRHGALNQIVLFEFRF